MARHNAAVIIRHVCGIRYSRPNRYNIDFTLDYKTIEDIVLFYLIFLCFRVIRSYKNRLKSLQVFCGYYEFEIMPLNILILIEFQ